MSIWLITPDVFSLVFLVTPVEQLNWVKRRLLPPGGVMTAEQRRTIESGPWHPRLQKLSKLLSYKTWVFECQMPESYKSQGVKFMM